VEQLEKKQSEILVTMDTSIRSRRIWQSCRKKKTSEQPVIKELCQNLILLSFMYCWAC